MDEKPVTADVVVACLFAGVGAWGAAVSVSHNDTIYASELFGEGHPSPMYPKDKAPMVVLTIPQDLTDRTMADNRDACMAQGHNGEADITFALSNGATFNSNVAGLMWDPDGMGGTLEARPAPGTVATIKDGGRKGNSTITITVKPAANEPDDTGVEEGDTARFGGVRSVVESWVDQEKCAVASGRIHQTISFELPRLANLDALAGANALDMNPKNDQPAIKVSGSSRIVSGSFTDGSLTGLAPPVVISSRDAVTLEIDPKNDEKAIAIDGDGAFTSIKGATDDGYVPLATITIQTKQIDDPAVAPVPADDKYKLQVGASKDSGADQNIYTTAKPGAEAVPYYIYDLDGDLIDEGLRGVLIVHARGTRGLFNEDDMLFVDYDKNGKMGNGEEIKIDADMMNMAMSNALSIDPEKSESFTEAGEGAFKVYYKAGGKGHINHEAMINLTAMVHYSDPSANNEADAKAATTLKFDGVGNAVMAYAIAQTDNGRGDSSNLRVRCEASTDCRVFLECWGDDGTETRGFGEVEGGVPADGVEVWTAAKVEDVTGRMPDSRHSCRVLSKGMVTVQQLTRSEGVLVNNTAVGGG